MGKEKNRKEPPAGGVPDWLRQVQQLERRFWGEVYPRMSFDERVKHWADTLGRSLRQEAGNGGDPYAVFSREWYESVKAQEPELDRVMEAVFERYWAGTWEREKYVERVERQG